MKRIACKKICNLSHIAQELQTLMATDWSLVPGLVIMADDGAGTVYSLHGPCLLHCGPGIYVFTAGVAIMTILPPPVSCNIVINAAMSSVTTASSC